MIRRSVALAVVAACGLATGLAASQRPAAQTTGAPIDEIVARNLDAKGGLAKLKAITTLKQTGSVTMPMMGIEGQMTLYGKRPNMVRQEISINGQQVTNAFDGKTPWIINPFAGPPPARVMVLSGPQAEQIKLDSRFDGPLMDYTTEGYSIALDGPETVGDKKLLHLRLTAPNRRVTNVYLDAATYLDVKHSMSTEQAQLEQQFDDYRTVDGFTVPFRVRHLVNGVLQSEITWKTIEFNVTVDDALFRLPK